MTQDADELVLIGHRVRAHGVRGEVAVEPLSGEPGRFTIGLSVVWRRAGHDDLPLTVTASRGKGVKAYVTFGEIASREDAQKLNGGELWGAASTSPELDDGTWYHHQLIGLAVNDEHGNPLGELTAITSSGAHDNYEVTMDDGQTFLVPAVPAFILDINLDAGSMTIQPIPGLMPDKHDA